MAGGLLIRALEHADLPALLELYRDLNPSDPPLTPEDAASIWRQFSRYTGSAIFVGVQQETWSRPARWSWCPTSPEAAFPMD